MINLNIFAPTKPHPAQKEVLQALDSKERFVLLRAGRKWRKTSLAISWLFEKAFETGLVCPYICPNRVQGKNIAWGDHITRILDEFKRLNVPYEKNEVELSIKLPNGGKVQILGVENCEALRGISNWGAISLDEYDDFASPIWPTIIRPNLITNKAPALITGTPKGFRNLYGLEQSGLFKCFHYTTYDNPEIDKDELASLVKEYQQMGEDYYNQEILAMYTKPVGLVYSEWNFETNFKEIPYDPNLPLHLTFDFGVNDPTSIIWIQRNNGEFRCVDYYEASNASVDHFVQVIRSKPYKVPELLTGDPAGRARSITTNTSPIEEYRNHGFHITTKDGVKLDEQIRTCHKYITSLFVDSVHAEGLKDVLLNYRYPTKKDTLINQSNEVPLHDKYSHGARALEYYFVNIDTSPVEIENKRLYGDNFEYVNNSYTSKKPEGVWRIGK